jgi:hypothetical protein
LFLQTPLGIIVTVVIIIVITAASPVSLKFC